MTTRRHLGSGHYHRIGRRARKVGGRRALVDMATTIIRGAKFQSKKVEDP